MSNKSTVYHDERYHVYTHYEYDNGTEVKHLTVDDTWNVETVTFEESHPLYRCFLYGTTLPDNAIVILNNDEETLQ